MSFFRGLRRLNRPFPDQNSFVLANANQLGNNVPSGFQNVLSAPSVRPIPNSNQYMPGYNTPNNDFVSTAQVNTALRNGDPSGIRNIFGNVNANQLNGVNNVRRLDNVPDPTINARNTRKNDIKNQHPGSRTNTPEGVDQFLNQQPRLRDNLLNRKTAGVALVGAGVVLLFSANSLVQDIIAALNRTGGSFYYSGSNNGEDVQACWLQYRSCGVPATEVPDELKCTGQDPILFGNTDALRQICFGYNREREGSVCRASDPNADPESPQYVDLSDMLVNDTLLCVEPYELGDLIGDLGLDWLLNEEGLVAKSKNSSKSIGEALMPLIIAIGVILFVVFIGFIIFKRLTAPQPTVSVAAAPPQR